MKKGFTLIELLAVILILGIIALIAIPTVNKILNEAREGAFITSSKNIMKAMEESCQTSLIRGKNPTLGYTFTDGKINISLNVKGTMPDDGYVFLNNDCAITDYYLKKQNYTYTNGEDFRQNYMLKEKSTNQSIFKEMYPDYFDSIVSVNFVNHLTIPEGAIGEQDPSLSGEGKIKSWLIQDGLNYNLYIGSEGKIFANTNSSYLFHNLQSVIRYDLSNFNTNFTTNMTALFSQNISLTSIDVNKLIIDNVKTIERMFYNCNKLVNIDVSNWNTSNITNMSDVFNDCVKIQRLDVSKWDVSNVTTMYHLFEHCRTLTSLDVTNWDTSKVVNMSYLFGCDNGSKMNLIEIRGIENLNVSNVQAMNGIFQECSNLKKIDLSNWDTSSLKYLSYAFEGCTSLETLNLSSINFSDISSMVDLFVDCSSLKDLIIKDATSSNLLTSYIPVRTFDSPGTLTIIGNKTGVDTTTLSSIYWNVI